MPDHGPEQGYVRDAVGAIRKRLGALGNPLEWSDPLRCLVVALITLPYPFANAAEMAAVRADPARAPFLNLEFVGWFEQSQLVSGYIWVFMVAVCALALWARVKCSFALVALTAFAFGAGQGVLAYCLGTLTTPSLITFLGSTLAAAVWLGLRAAIIGMSSGGLIVIGTTIAERAGHLPYGPLVKSAPFHDGILHPWWYRAAGLTAVGYTAGTLALIGIVLYLWRRRERELAAANAELARAAEIKDRFVDTVSHELRTPLTSILGSLRLLAMKHESAQSEDVAEILEIAERNTGRLERLVRDLLDIRALESGELIRERAPTCVTNLVAEACAELQPLAETEEVRVVCGFAPGAEADFLADPDRLSQVIWNLLDNAIKHSPAGGIVHITLAPGGAGGLTITVDDEGAGLPEEPVEELFAPFHRAGNLRTNPGSGLGLAIVKAITDALGGSIRAENRPEGGARFVAELPLESAG